LIQFPHPAALEETGDINALRAALAVEREARIATEARAIDVRPYVRLEPGGSPYYARVNEGCPHGRAYP
jgi:hypothetical protein